MALDMVSMILTMVIAAILPLMVGLVVISHITDSISGSVNVTSFNALVSMPDPSPVPSIFAIIPIIMIVGLLLAVVVTFLGRSPRSDDSTYREPPRDRTSRDRTERHATSGDISDARRREEPRSEPRQEPAPEPRRKEEAREEEKHNRWERLEI